MQRFLQSKLGVLCLCGFALLMAFMFMRVLSRPKEAPEKATPAKHAKTRSGQEQAPASATVPDKASAPMSEELAYLDRVREPSRRLKSDRDREGLPVTRRRTAGSPSSTRREPRSPAEEQTPSGGLRLSGRTLPQAVAPKAAPEEDQEEKPPLLPSAASISSAMDLRAPTPETRPFVPYGRPIRCELVFTIDSTMEETPLVGLVVDPVYNNGELCLPAGTELHGMARPDRLRDRIFSAKDWILVLPREKSLPSGRQIAVRGLALDRDETSLDTLSWGITDGSNGLRGTVIRSMDSEEIKRFAATFLSAAALTLQEREGSGRTTRRVTNTPANAALAGLANSLEEIARKISEEIERNGVFIRVPGGKQFYFYPQQSIEPRKAAIP